MQSAALLMKHVQESWGAMVTALNRQLCYKVGWWLIWMVDIKGDP